MISGLKAKEYEERLKELELTTLEERRHQADMAMVYKVLTGRDQVDHEEWFTRVGEAARAARAGADLMNIASNMAVWTLGGIFSLSELQSCGT